MTAFKPMLSGTVEDVSTLCYPVLVSPKLDGFRALVQGGCVLSRNLKPIRNGHVQALFGRPEYEGFDGELIVGTPTEPDCFSVTSSGVTAAAGQPDVTFWVFDMFAEQVPFRTRHFALADGGSRDGICVLQHHEVHSPTALLAVAEGYLESGYEGLMVRDPDGPYKQGRSTLKEGWLLKYKEFEYDDALIVEVLQGQHNANADVRDALGHAKRSTTKAGMHPNGTLGGFKCVGLTGPWKGMPFNVGPGRLTAAQAQSMYDQRGDVVGTHIEYKYFPRGCKDAPRFPGYFGPAIKGKHSLW